MDSDQTIEEGVGMRLYLENKKTLTMGTNDLVLSEAGFKGRGASWAFCPIWTSDGSEATQSVPLSNVLWAEASNGRIMINYAAHASKTLITPRQWSFDISPKGNAPGEPSPEAFVSALLSRAYGDAPSRKRAYVLINPNSGPGGAVRKYNEEVKPLFQAARMELEEVVLTRGGEATELVQRADLTKYDTIMACSGDGTPHEIFNGLAKRPDAKTALSSVAVSHIPCGSGNAFSCNLYGSHRASFAALAIIKGIITPMDLVSVTQGNTRLISFLSQTLGIVAESDLGTEHLRWMGSARFEVGVLSRLFSRKCYPCDLAVKVEVDEKEGVKAHYKRHASETSLAKMAKNVDGEASEGEGLPPLKYGTVQDDLPEGWELVPYDKIGTFYAGNMAYMSPDAKFFSASLISDGCMDLVTIDGDLSPVTALKVLLDVEKGKSFDNPHVNYKKITAYRIIPRDQDDGFISIDGEKVPFEPFQAEIHQGLGRVISKAGKYEAEGPPNWDKVTLADRIRA